MLNATYKRAVFLMISYLVFTLNTVRATEESYEFCQRKCKEYATTCKQFAGPMIVGGSDALPEEFPHIALVGFGDNDDTQWECGGALISENFVLSAAHCGDSRELGKATKIKFGLTKRSENAAHVQERKIVNIIIHPEYKRPMKYNDIALFELDHPVEFSNYVRPACLNSLYENPLELSDIPNAIGFGKTKFTEHQGNEYLQKVSLPLLQNEICQPFYNSMKVSTLTQGLIDTQLCAGVIEGGKDTCQGDSGGPLHMYLQEPYCNYNLIGVTSFGKFCGYAKSPAVYTHVYKYIPWITKTVWQQ